MKMQMVHNLAGILPRVGHGAVAGFSDARALGHLLHSSENVAEYCGIVNVQIIHRSEVFLRNHQYMDRSLWLNVVKGQNQVIFIDLIRGDLTGDYLTKNAVR